jgi:hypothetical protein
VYYGPKECTPLLHDKDICLADKMNFSAVQRLCKPHIITLLHTYVPGKFDLVASETMHSPPYKF